jgi:hypothetical protein
MSTHTPRVLLVALCLLALATSASAESAWVLWKYEALPPPAAKSTTAAWGPVKQIQWTNMGVNRIGRIARSRWRKLPRQLQMYTMSAFPTPWPKGAR